MIRAYTLAELMVSLSIFSVASTAITSLIFASYNVNTQVQGESSATSSAEIALRRIMEEMRSGTSVSFTNASSGLYVQTPADSGGSTYIYIYYVTGNVLHEKIEVASSQAQIQDSAIVSNVGSFNVTRLNSGSAPQSYQVDLTLNSTPVAVTRSVVVTGRNLTSP